MREVQAVARVSACGVVQIATCAVLRWDGANVSYHGNEERMQNRQFSPRDESPPTAESESAQKETQDRSGGGISSDGCKVGSPSGPLTQRHVGTRYGREGRRFR